MVDFENLLVKTKVYNTLKQEALGGKISQCVMIVTEDSIACKNMCKLLARVVLCETEKGANKKDAILVENSTHPSVFTPYDFSAESLKDFVQSALRKVDTKYKVLLIDNFDEIKLVDQNRLLKLIEEPTEDTVFIIGVSNPNAVLETIKSRAAKYVLEKFEYDELKEALLEKYDAYNVEKAMVFAEGSVASAVSIISNPEFIVAYETMRGIMMDMQKSGGLLEMVNRVPFKTKRTLEEKRDLLSKYLDAFEVVIKQVFEVETSQNKIDDAIIKQISEKYNVNTLINVEDLILDAKRKIELNCDPEGVFYQLLMSILEVKFKCQLS